MFVAYVSVNSLTHKVKELEGEMLVADSSGILNDSVDNEDAVIDQGCDDEDEDDQTIEEEPDFSLDGEHDLSSESDETDTSSIEDESTKTKAKRLFCTSKHMNSKLHDLKILLPLPACKNALHLEKAVGQDTDNDWWRDHLHVQAKCHLICFMHHTINDTAGCHYLQFSI